MSILISNEFLLMQKKREYSWYACNGRNQQHLIVINKYQNIEKNIPTLVQICTLSKYKTSYIFINKPQNDNNSESEEIIGLYLNDNCGYDCIPAQLKIFEAESVGGPGNKRSKMGLYHNNVIIKEYSYKNRSTESYYKLTNEKWEYLGEDIPIERENIPIEIV